MNVKKLIAMVLCLVMVLSLTAITAAAEGEVSIDFEDGNMGFVAVYDGMANSDASILEVVEWGGSKALKVTNGSGKVPYVAIDVASLVGDRIADVAAVKMEMGLEREGKFFAASGNVILWDSKKLGNDKKGWSVYMEKKNPKETVFEGMAFSADAAPVMVVTLDTDAGLTKGAPNAALIIDNICFLDASGNVIPADTTASFVAPNGFGGSKDMSNLVYLKDTVELAGMAGKAAGAWAQDGVEMSEEFLAALVPGSVIEIEYSSENGDMWLVMPWAAAGWSRVQQQTAATNNSKNICQITYEQIEEVCGEDISTWGAMMQCEASGAWEVYSVVVGQDSGLVHTANKTVIDGFATSADAWAQDGVELTEEQIAMLQPGTIIEINYTSENGDMWLVMPWAAAGWSRIEQQTAACNGSVCQITYEQIAAVCGEDVSTWGTMMQCEASGAWEVYSVSICTGKFVNTTGNVELPGFAKSAGAWAQDGIELTEEQIALLVPGSVITIQYTSSTGDLWLVMPWAAAGWSRIQQQTAACDGSVCQITYEQIAAVCGEDVSTWGTMMQCESSGDWEVYSVSIGTAVNAAPAEEEAPVEETEAVEETTEAVVEEAAEVVETEAVEEVVETEAPETEAPETEAPETEAVETTEAVEEETQETAA